MDNLEQIQDQRSIEGGEDEIISVLDTEPDGTADCVSQRNLPHDTNISNAEPSISHNNNDVLIVASIGVYLSTLVSQ